jgi:TP901 family phage tail tape measure protein
MPQLDPLRARIQLDGGAQAAAALRAVATQAKLTRTSMLGLSAGVAAAGAALAALAISEAVKFESALAGVQKTTGATEEELAQLAEQFRTLATQIPVSANELARLGQVAGQLGIGQADIAAFVEITAKLGAAVDDLSPEQAATQLARFANVAGTSAAQFENLASALVALGNTTATTEGEILTLSSRIVQAGTQIGLTEGEIFGFAASLREVGVEAESGGTALSRTFVAIQDAVITGNASLATFAETAGMTAAEFQQAFEKDAAGAITSFLGGLQGIIESGGSVTEVLGAVGLAQERTRRALLGAAAASDKLTANINRGNTEFFNANALQREAEVRFGTTASQIQILQNNMANLASSIGDKLLPKFNALLEVTNNVLHAFGLLSRGANEAVVTGLARVDKALEQARNTGLITLQDFDDLTRGIRILAAQLSDEQAPVFLSQTSEIIRNMSGTAKEAGNGIRALFDQLKKVDDAARQTTGSLGGGTGGSGLSGAIATAETNTSRFVAELDRLARSLGLRADIDGLAGALRQLEHDGDLTVQTIDSLTNRMADAGLTAGATGDASGDLSNEMDRAARAGVDFANGMGLIDDSLARTLDSMINLTSATFDLVDALGQIGGGAASGGIFGAIAGIAGALVGLIGGLFGKGENDKFRENAEIVLTLLAEQDELLQEIANSLDEDVLGALDRIAAVRLGDKIDSDEAEALVRQLGQLGLGFTDLKDLAQKFGINIDELIKVLITGEGDRKLAAEQFLALQQAIGLLPDPLEEVADAAAEAAKALEEAAQQVRDALSELGQELGDIDFETEVFALTLQQQFGRVLEEVFKALADSGDPVLQGAADSLKSLLGLDLTTTGGRESALSAIQAFVTAVGDDVPNAIKSAVRELLGLIENFEDEVPAVVVDPLAQERRQMERALRRIGARESEIEAELARLNRGLPGSAVGVQQSVSITGIQANELLSVTRTNMFHNSRTANAAEQMQVAMLEIAHAVGGDLLVQRISERLGSQYVDQLARQGVAA